MTVLHVSPSTFAPGDPAVAPERRAVAFRLKAFALHLSASATLLALVLGALYIGWYRWPGWYLAGMRPIAAVLVTVDLALGPLLTLLIASPAKPRREFKRDIAVIVTIQLLALAYGSGTLWRGRPLYYAFSVDRLEMVQAYDLSDSQIALGRQANPALAPTWHGLPRWVWAPLPGNPEEQKKIITSAISGGADVVQMPRYFRPWTRGISELRKQLKKPGVLAAFSKAEKESLERQMMRLGLATDQPTTILLTGRVGTALAVFDRSTMDLKTILAPSR